MPWQVEMVVMIGAVGAPIQWYVAHRLSRALRSVTNKRSGSIRTATFLVVFYPALYPLVSLGSFLSGTGGLSQNSALVDDAFKYPFWIGTVIAVQFGLVLFALDATRLLLFPLYRKRRQGWVLLTARVTVALAILTMLYCGIKIRTDT